MVGFNVYQTIIALIVYVLLVVFIVTVIWVIINSKLKLIKLGMEDKSIIKEREDNLKKKENVRVRVLDWVNKIASLLFSCLVIVVFVFSIVLKVNENKKVGDFALFKVVASGSMSRKHKENAYLFREKLDNQFSTFDLILLEKLPDEFDIKLYDVIMYEYEDTLIIHRVIGIEEPNEQHPDSRRFTFRGDYVEASDRFQVTYDQMRGMYSGKRIPFVGSFVFFLQSPAGAMCIILILIFMIAIPIIEKKINKARERRLYILLFEALKSKYKRG